MRIVYRFGPRAGEIAHVPRSQEIQVLLATGIIEELPPDPPAPPAPPTWDAFRTINDDLVIVRKMADGSTTYFNAPPEGCPAHIVQKFNELKRPGEQPVRLMFAGSGWRAKLPI